MSRRNQRAAIRAGRRWTKSTRALICAVALALVGNNLAAKEKILIVTEEWGPYAGQNLKDQGILAKIVRRLFQDAPYELEFKFYPWDKALLMARTGEADCLLGAFYSPERAIYLDYPTPILEQNTALFQLAKNDFTWANVADLKRYRVGRVKNAINGAEFDRLDGDNVSDLIDLNECLRLLVYGRVDLVAGPEINVQYLLKTDFREFKDQVKRLDRIIDTQKIWCAVSKRSRHAKDLTRVIDEGMAKLQTDKEYLRLKSGQGY
jgi:polar amino acid transport system substrate-binding protein